MYVCAYMCMCVWVCMHVGAHVNVWACVWNPKADIRSPSLSMFSIKAGSHSELADMLFSWPASFEDLLSLPSEHWDCGMPDPPDICGGSGNLSSCPHPCMAKPLPSKPASAMQWLILIVKLIGCRKTWQITKAHFEIFFGDISTVVKSGHKACPEHGQHHIWNHFLLLNYFLGYWS